MNDDEQAVASKEWFIAAIHRGYEAERQAGNEHIQPAHLWDHVVAECMEYSRGFELMFAWDKRKGRQNRIGTITDFIRDGKVPGLRLVPGRHGHPEVASDTDEPMPREESVAAAEVRRLKELLSRPKDPGRQYDY